MVQVLGAPSRPDRDPVDLVVQPVQEETQELLSVLLAVTHTRARAEGGVTHVRYSHTRCSAQVWWRKVDGGLLVTHKSGSVSLDLGLELGRADCLAAGRRPHGLDELGKFWRATTSEVSSLLLLARGLVCTRSPSISAVLARLLLLRSLRCELCRQ